MGVSPRTAMAIMAIFAIGLMTSVGIREGFSPGIIVVSSAYLAIVSIIIVGVLAYVRDRMHK